MRILLVIITTMLYRVSKKFVQKINVSYELNYPEWFVLWLGVKALVCGAIFI